MIACTRKPCGRWPIGLHALFRMIKASAYDIEASDWGNPCSELASAREATWRNLARLTRRSMRGKPRLWERTVSASCGIPLAAESTEGASTVLLTEG